jgi:TRAP-type C4-dicarboxylate transport system permease small subunit
LSSRVTEIALAVIGSGMVIVIAVQVFSRYALNHSLFWSEEVGRICLVWITFLGGSVAYKNHGHIGVDFFVKRLPIHMQRLCAVMVLLLSLAFFGVLMIFGFKFALFVSSQRTTALGLPLAFPYVVIPLAGALFCLHALDSLLHVLHPEEPAV